MTPNLVSKDARGAGPRPHTNATRHNPMTDEDKKNLGKARTISLSSHAPVRIYENEWPIISSAREEEPEGKETSRWWLTVRKHQDGRHLVYARYEVTGEKGEPLEKLVGGELLAARANISESVTKVGEECHCPATMVARCLKGLPVEEI